MSHGPKLNRDWKGLRVRLLRTIESSLCEIPKGTVCTVVEYHHGRRAIEIKTNPCKCCGISARMTALKRWYFEILTPEDEWPNSQGKGRNWRARI